MRALEVIIEEEMAERQKQNDEDKNKYRVVVLPGGKVIIEIENEE